MLFVKPELLEMNALLKEEYNRKKGEFMSLVHPRLFTNYTQRHNELVSLVPGLAKWFYRKFIKKPMALGG